jgi:D-proline reductase (dithiol) PrdB
MREDFEDRPTARRFSDDEELQASPIRRKALLQGLETLRERYSWIGYFREQHPGYAFLELDSLPWTTPGLSLHESKVALVTTAGVHLKTQKPFSISPGEITVELLRLRFKEKGDPSYRVIPVDAELTDIRVAHPYVPLSAAEEDVNAVFPLGRLRALEEENFIGSAASRHFSFMGYLPNPLDVEPYAREVASQLVRDQVDVVLLTPSEVLSHQTMAVIQNAIEEEGVVTVSVALCRDIVEQVGVPRSVHYRYPFGFTFGDANDEAMQLRILKDALRGVELIAEPGGILDLPYQWAEE